MRWGREWATPELRQTRGSPQERTRWLRFRWLVARSGRRQGAAAAWQPPVRYAGSFAVSTAGQPRLGVLFASSLWRAMAVIVGAVSVIGPA